MHIKTTLMDHFPLSRQQKIQKYDNIDKNMGKQGHLDGSVGWASKSWFPLRTQSHGS